MSAGPCPHLRVRHIGDRTYTLRKARQIYHQYECADCGAFLQRAACFIDFGTACTPDELARLQREERAADPVARRRRERAAGQTAIGAPSPLLDTPPPPPDPAWRALGDKLRAARLAQGWTLRDLSAATAIGLGPLRRMQAGRVLPTPAEFDALARALHLEVTAEEWALVGSAVRP